MPPKIDNQGDNQDNSNDNNGDNSGGNGSQDYLFGDWSEEDAAPRQPVQANTKSVRVMMTIPATLLKTVDYLAKADYMTRSDAVRTALTEYVRKPDSLEKMAIEFTGKDVVFQRYLDEFNKEYPDE